MAVPKKELTLDQFMAKVRAEATRFEVMWRDENKESAADYPMSMAEADWWEQLTVFLS